MSLFLRIAQYLRPYRRRFGLALALVGAGALPQLAQPWPLKITLDYVLGDEPVPPALSDLDPGMLLLLVCVSLFLLQLASAGLALWLNHVSIGIGQRMVSDLRAQVLSHLQGLSLGFFDRRSTSDLVYRVAFDSFAVQSMLMNGLFPLISGITLLAGMAVVLLRMNAPLAMIFLAAAPLLSILIATFGRRIEGVSQTQREQESRFLAETQRGVEAIHVVQAFGAERREHRRAMEASSHALGAALRLYLLQTGYSGAVNTIIGLGTAAVLYAGGLIALRGQLSAGDLVVFITYLATLYGPIHSVSQTAGLMRAAAAGARRVFEVLDTEADVRDPEVAVPLREPAGEVRFAGVSFAYPDGTQALRDVSFIARPGMRVAIVGHTGAGKSTLARLIPRFQDPTQGAIFLDGVDLRKLRRRELRRYIGIVPQSPLLFPATLADNIRYGRPDASQQELEHAAEVAGVASFARALPLGYDSFIGPEGQRLSQGQMQRVTIARALLCDPRILILDEPTSALDPETEAYVVGGIEQAMKGRTSFVIAHRLSTVQRADLVLVLAGGRVIERGSFEALRRAGGPLQRMCEAHLLLEDRSGGVPAQHAEGVA